MLVALISETGIRFMDVSVLTPEIRLAVKTPVRVRTSTKGGTTVEDGMRIGSRRFVRMDDHTYVEKN